jgi:hypothetical protein
VEKLRALIITASKQDSYTKGTTLKSDKEYADNTQMMASQMKTFKICVWVCEGWIKTLVCAAVGRASQEHGYG